MFCSQCGNQLPANAKFCAACGQPVPASASSPAVAPPVAASPSAPAAPAADLRESGVKISVRLQGADAALKANGSYDEVSLGKVSATRLHEILLALLPQTPPDGDDVCAINVMAAGPKGEMAFMVDGGKITNASGDREYSADDAVRAVLGGATQAVKIKLPKGWKPVRHPELPPTDRDEADPTKVNTSSQPQAAVKLWVGELSHYAYWMCWVAIGMCALVLLGSFGPFRPKPFLVGLVGGGLLFWCNRAAKRSGFQEVRMGADWGTNTIWVHSDGKTHLTPDASCVQDFQVVARTVHVTTGQGLKRQTHTKSVYTLAVVMSDGRTENVRGLPEMAKRKSDETLAAARGLLGRL